MNANRQYKGFLKYGSEHFNVTLSEKFITKQQYEL